MSETKELHLLTGYGGFFGQTRKPWVSLDTVLLIRELESLGWLVHCHEFHEVINGAVDIHDSIVFYTFSHRPNLQGYIRDCLLSLQAKNNRLVPSQDLFCCHENKGWQELLRRQTGLDSLWSRYFSSKRELKDYAIPYPVVLKTLTGSNSKGVYLVRGEDELLHRIRLLEPSPSIGKRLDFLRRRYLRGRKEFPGYPDYDVVADYRLYRDYITPEIPFILQEYVPSLSFDYRVIALGDRFYASKRLTRKGDFRASGAKLFTFDFPPPVAVLDYARELKRVLNTPFLSIDLGESADGKLSLFEFQALHFGINAIVLGHGWYESEGDRWLFRAGKTVFEAALANGLDQFMRT